MRATGLVTSGRPTQHDPLELSEVGQPRHTSEVEQKGYDPKDGELSLMRMKPEETLVEVRRGSDVQIDRHN